MAAVGDDQDQQEAEQCAHAGVVRPDQAVDPPLRQIQIDAVEEDDVTERL